MRVAVWTAALVLLGASGSALAQDQGPSIQVPQAEHRTPRISGGVMAGNILNKVQPVYPQEAKEKHIGGVVVLHAIIAKDGHIQKLEAIAGPDLLKDAAIDAVRQWVYRPYILNGEPTDVDTTITVNFNMNIGGPASTANFPGGVYGGTNNAVSSPLPTGAVRISGGVMAGLLIKKPDAIYPPIAKAAHVGGSVVLHALINKEGQVTRLDIISGPDMLKRAALNAVRQYVYKPYLLNDEPQDVDTTVVVNFNISD